ncbi:alpha/beta fold hydrolase [Oceanomicrobium pacificus]|uniref:Alpha/beta fold hydrolase n=1 Tax=Oceanomicrobium pacificus TaxID=2692916 RepID=A0A6B0TV20_9RHOB|nr:alpha/beta hydrolase [Oceanomicrobium pacificus]MXU64803.1 alpha/beta fold hydrolase [Oceanomicrobium pacificus]
MTLPLLLLPGMMCNARLFAPQVAALSPSRTVSVPGIGGADNMTELAAAVLADAPDRFALGGVSMGGIVAMEIVRQAPDRVAGLALLSTNPLPETDTIRLWREPQIEAVQAGHLQRVMRDELKPNYVSDVPHRQEVLDTCMTMAVELGPDVFVRQSRALQSRPDQTETLRALDVPALVLCGSEDLLCPVARHEMMHELIPDSTLTILPGIGHLATLEAPDDVTAALEGWLAHVH